jgi:hypothetical protein
VFNRSGSFEDDLLDIVDAIWAGVPFSFARFHDGELAVCEGRRYRAAADEWSSTFRAWLREPLLASLKYHAPGYVIGISPSCCCPKGTTFYGSRIRAPTTFATLFQNANYQRAFNLLAGIDRITVGCRDEHDVRVPNNAVEHEWDVDSVVGKLVGVTKPVFLAAGPASCVIAHRLWARYNKVPIVDVGSLFDSNTREFQNPISPIGRHECAWEGGRPCSGVSEDFVEPEHEPWNPRAVLLRRRLRARG